MQSSTSAGISSFVWGKMLTELDVFRSVKSNFFWKYIVWFKKNLRYDWYTYKLLNFFKDLEILTLVFSYIFYVELLLKLMTKICHSVTFSDLLSQVHVTFSFSCVFICTISSWFSEVACRQLSSFFVISRHLSLPINYKCLNIFNFPPDTINLKFIKFGA